MTDIFEGYKDRTEKIGLATDIIKLVIPAVDARIDERLGMTDVPQPAALGSASWQIRVEALRAAAIMYGPVWAELMRAALASGKVADGLTGEAMVEGLIKAADPLAAWLETGKR